MRKKKETAAIAETKPVATTPIRGEKYERCFDVPELAKAAQHFRRQGHSVNLILSLPEMTLPAVREASLTSSTSRGRR